jgi:hypothetical protein
MWTLDEGLKFVRDIQPVARRFNYHISLGGSVLNYGQSNKDLDVYFLPLDNGCAGEPTALKNWLESKFGLMAPLGGEEYADESDYLDKFKLYTLEGKRVDCFVM